MFSLLFRQSNVPYDMFDAQRSAEEALRFHKCERIYHLGQEMAWDGKDVLAMLLAQHGRPALDDQRRHALESILTVVLWGEMAAWKISSQLANGLVPLEAKMAATSQAHDEARHFYVMYDYLNLLGWTAAPMDAAPQALLDLVLNTKDMPAKILGMQLMVETMALAIFQALRESDVEPILCDLLKYYERDEARHVGLGVQHLPDLVRGASKAERMRLNLFQVQIMSYALWEAKALDKHFRVLGVSTRSIVERARRKQIAAFGALWEAMGLNVEQGKSTVSRASSAAIEAVFPASEAPIYQRARTVARLLRGQEQTHVGRDELSQHDRHVIRTARDRWAGARAGVEAQQA